jgi:hypothetical protein
VLYLLVRLCPALAVLRVVLTYVYCNTVTGGVMSTIFFYLFVHCITEVFVVSLFAVWGVFLRNVYLLQISVEIEGYCGSDYENYCLSVCDILEKLATSIFILQEFYILNSPTN